MRKGSRMTLESRLKLSNSLRGRKISEKTREKYSERMKGNKYSIGYKHSLEARQNMSKAQTGRKHKYVARSEEEKKRMSERMIGAKNPMFGKKQSEEHRKKNIEGHKGIFQSIETRKKRSESHRGEKSHFWIDGRTPINQSIRRSLEYKLWREAVFNRDNHTCVWCGARSGKGNAVILNADHIKSFALYPELRFAIDNGRTLCLPCHKTTDTYMGRGRWGNNNKK